MDKQQERDLTNSDDIADGRIDITRSQNREGVAAGEKADERNADDGGVQQSPTGSHQEGAYDKG